MKGESNMELIGVIGIIVGLVFFVIAAMKGWNVLITSVVTAVIIAVTNGMGIADAMLGAKSSYVAGTRELRSEKPAHLHRRSYFR